MAIIARVLSHFSRVRLFATPWTIAQAPLPVGFSRQEHWSAMPFPPPGDLPNAGSEPVSLTSHAVAGGFFTLPLVPPEKPHKSLCDRADGGAVGV